MNNLYKCFIIFFLLLFIGVIYSFTQYDNESQKYINQRINNIGGQVIKVSLFQKKDLMIYRITYKAKNNKIKHAIYMDSLDTHEFDFVN